MINFISLWCQNVIWISKTTEARRELIYHTGYNSLLKGIGDVVINTLLRQIFPQTIAVYWG